MKSATRYLSFNTLQRRELIRITEELQAAVEEAGIGEGMVLASAMHITAGVWVNDDEPGLHEDALEWLDKVAPPNWIAPRQRGRLRAATRGRRPPPPPRRRGPWRRPPEGDGGVTRFEWCSFWSHSDAKEHRTEEQQP